jgi:hypothetical protein
MRAHLRKGQDDPATFSYIQSRSGRALGALETRPARRSGNAGTFGSNSNPSAGLTGRVFDLSQTISQRPLLLSFGALLIAFGKYRVIDRPADMEREGQLTIFQRPSSQPREQIRHKSLLRDDLRHALVVQLIGASDAHTP